MRERFDVSEPYRVEHIDVRWARIDGVAFHATVWRPATDRPARSPWATLLDVHGGAWTYCDRSSDSYVNRRLAACGTVVIAIDFRLAPENPYPAACIDVNAATRWLKREVAALGGTPERLGAIGGSSGGHLVLLSALRPFDTVYASAAGHETIEPWSPGGGPDASLAYVVALWPITDVPECHERAQRNLGFHESAPERVKGNEGFFETSAAREVEASPIHVVREGRAQQLPPVLLQQPDRDTQTTTPMQEAFAEAYRAAGGTIDFVNLPGMAHAPASEPGADADHCIEIMKRFIATQLPA